MQKHLLKKHVEYLTAEQSAVNDKYMMQRWETSEIRPLPHILVDCGQFGIQEVCVVGADPIAADPEPELYRRVEERRRRAEEGERYEIERREREQAKRYAEERQRASNDKMGFVDVDDMKEDKVTLAYDDAELPAAAPPKKKKKKKNKLA